MKKNIIGITFVIFYHVIWGVVEWKYQTSNWLYLLPLILSAITLIIGFWPKKEIGEDIQALKKTTEEATRSTQKLIRGEAQETREGNDLNYKIHLDNLMNIQFNRFLSYQKLDRDVLLRELEGNKVETLYIIKQKEAGDEKPLKERIKLLGFKHVTYGDWILPPKKLKDKSILRRRGGVKKWVEENLIKDINLEEFVNSVVIVNLSNIYDEEKGESNRAKKIIGGILRPADLVSKEKLLSEIHKKEKISLKEILQIPFLDSLIDSGHPLISEQIKNLNSEIVEKIKEKLDMGELNTTDIDSLTREELEKILKALDIKSFKLASENILTNVKIIKSYLNQTVEN